VYLGVAAALVFAYQALLPRAELDFVFLRWAAIPLEVLEQDLEPATPLHPAVTLLTSLFLHGGLVHLLSNLLFLAAFGPPVERKLGHLLTLVLYLAAGAAGGLVQASTTPTSLLPLIGASGAIASLLGAYVVVGRAHALRTPLLLLWLGWQVWEVWAMTDAPLAAAQWLAGTAVWSHLTGFVMGVVCAAMWRLAASAQPWARTVRRRGQTVEGSVA
jgi:membrane associated rhomboid family serine protease